MITLLSPSKGQNFDPSEVTAHSQPQLLSQSKKLMVALKKMSPSEIQSLMSVSERLAELNYERFRQFSTPFKLGAAKQAVLAFQGDVYSGLKAEDMDYDDLEFAQNHLRILSGLYGYLNPLDLIMPYRLEMKTQLAVNGHENLYQFWGDIITDCLNTECSDKDTVINLASNEYFKAVKPKKLNSKIITINFKDTKDGKTRVVAIYAKIARGAMARAIIKNRINQPEDIKQLVVDDYRFQKDLSTDDAWVFTRKQPKPKT
ncbi:MAG: peroxide stress protein YaaA [Marinicella pacifica]|jgi:cytoplasmic iron level regulating protein YaaA (DUF328/UPF0246 family)